MQPHSNLQKETYKTEVIKNLVVWASNEQIK